MEGCLRTVPEMHKRTVLEKAASCVGKYLDANDNPKLLGWDFSKVLSRVLKYSRVCTSC